MDVTLPNGVVLRNVPQGTSKEQIKAKAIQAGLATEADFTGSQEEQQASTGILPGAVDRIPGQTFQPEAIPPEQQATSPSRVDYAIQGAMAVPPLAAAGRGLQFLAQGSKAAPYATSFAQSVMPRTGRGLVGEGALGAAAGVAGGVAGEQFPEGWQRDLATMAAGTAVAVPYAAGRNVFDIWVTRGLGGDVARAGGQAAETLGSAQATAQAATALRANPNLGPTVLRAQEIEANTGISLPMLAAANGDTTISSYLRSQTARGDNAEFTAALKLQYEAAEAALRKAQRGKAPSMEAVDRYVKQKALDLQRKTQQLTAARQAEITSIDNRIESLTADLVAPSRVETGTALRNLLASKERAIRSELSPRYKELIETASEQGIKLPGESAQELRSFVIDRANRDVFQKFPDLDRLIKKEFSSPVAAAASPRLAERYRFAVQAQQPQDVPLETLDSLKRSVNLAIRDTKDETNLRLLRDLKKQVDRAIDTVDPAFSQPYRALDREFATRLGLPFSEQGVVNIDRAQFVERTVPMLTRDPSTLRQVMSIVGDDPQGVRIVEDAFLFKIANDRSIVNSQTGQINTVQLNRYLNNPDTQVMLNEVPGLRDRLRNVSSEIQGLNAAKERVLTAQADAQAEYANNLWNRAYGSRDGIRGVIRNSRDNPQQMDNLVRLAQEDPIAQKAIKAALLEDSITAPGDRLESFRTNRAAFEKVFGKQDTNNLEYIIEASQRLRDNPFDFKVNINNITKTNYEQLTGSKVETSLGEMRNQVMRTPRVLINHFSRYFQGRSSAAENAEMQRFLSNPKHLADVATMMREFESKGVTDKVLNAMGRIVKNNISVYPLGAAAGFVGGMGAPEPDPYMPSDPTLLEGFERQ